MLKVPSYYGLLALGIVVMIAGSEALIVFAIWLKNRKEEKRRKARTEKNIV